MADSAIQLAMASTTDILATGRINILGWLAGILGFIILLDLLGAFLNWTEDLVQGKREERYFQEDLDDAIRNNDTSWLRRNVGGATNKWGE